MKLEQNAKTKGMTTEEVTRSKVRCDFESVVEDVQFRFGVCPGCEDLSIDDWVMGKGLLGKL